MLTRLLLLFSIFWVIKLTTPWFTIFGQEISGRDIILIGGGLFLLAKATHEIHGSLEGDREEKSKAHFIKCYSGSFSDRSSGYRILS